MRVLKTLVLPLWLLLAPSVHAQEVHISDNGLNLLGYLEMAEGKTIKDGIVLMTHGTLAHGQMEIMTALQGALKEAGINSIAITLSLGDDQRQGMYDCSHLQHSKHSKAVTEIGLWVNWLKGKGANNITLLGHSRGGNQTAWYAAEHHDPAIKHVVLIAPGYWTPASLKAEYEKQYHKDLDSVLAKAHALVKAGKGDTVMKEDFIYCTEANVTASSFVDYYGGDPHFYTPDLIKKILVPVLIIAGSQDTTVPNVAKVYGPALKSSDKIFTVEGADHFFRDLYVYDIVDQMTAFMGQ